MQLTTLTAALACAGTTLAWLPHDRRVDTSAQRLHARDMGQPTLELRDVNGISLFQRDGNGSAPALKKGMRGVNAGSFLVFEKWIDSGEWSKIGCGNAASEFDCGRALGQDGVNKAFKQHWSTFYTQDDIKQMASYGLNTLRIPVGYWLYEDIVDKATEPFPQGGMQYLKQMCSWAADAGMFVIVDHHGAPGAQTTNVFTGQNNPNPGFFTDANMERGLKFLEWMTTQIHSNNEFRSVGAIEVLNEPQQGINENTKKMISKFYPQAYSRIRAAEQKANVPSANQLHIQYMNQKWGSGDPAQNLPKDATNVMYDDHRYIKWAGTPTNMDAYMKQSCNDDRSASDGKPTLVGEWSLAVADSVEKNPDWSTKDHASWYKDWFGAQVHSYEKSTNGWIFWTWKTNLKDPRWTYQDAVNAGIIPKSLDNVPNKCGN